MPKANRDGSRREFLKIAATGGAAVAASSALPAFAAEPAKAKATSETLVATLFKSLTAEQKKVVAFAFDHPLRSKVDNNWMIAKAIADVFTKDQQAMIRDIFNGMHSPEYAEQVWDATVHDTLGKGFEAACSVALFGTPGAGKFEFVVAGRHVTRRCDGDSVEGAAFGGPIFYGHQAGDDDVEAADHPGNAYWYQARRANEVFKMLDGKQRKLALLPEPRPERGDDTVKLTGQKKGLPGIPMTELAADQKKLVRQVMADVLAPFRKTDAQEALKLVEANGFDSLHMAFFEGHDLGKDRVWDRWQIEGPAMLWYFRGSPHVHAWVHVRSAAA